MGYAHHSNFPIWFEMGRTELFRNMGNNYAAMEASGQYIVVVKLEVNYKSPARYDEELILQTTIAKASRAKLEHHYQLRRDDTLIATGKTIVACVGSNGRVHELPRMLVGGKAIGSAD